MKAETGSFHTDMNRAAKVSKQSGGQMSDAFRKASKAIGVAAIGVTAATAKMVESYTRDADKFSKLTDKLGGSTEAWSELEFVAERSGVKIEQLTMGLQRMTRRLGEAATLGKGEAVPALKMLGLNAQELLDKPIDKQFEAIAEELSKIPNESTRAALAMKFFDSEGVSLVQTMGDGAKGIQELREQARRFGVTISTESAEKAVLFNDRITDLKALTTGAGRAIAEKLVPTLLVLTEKLVDTGDGLNFAGKAAEFAGNFIRTLVAGAILLKGIFNALSKVVVAFGTSVVAVFKALISPVTRFNQALAEAFDALKSGDFRAAANAFGQLAGNIAQDFTDAGNTIADVVTDQMGEAWTDLKGGALEANDMLLGLSGTASDVVPPALEETADAVGELSGELTRLEENQIAIAAGFKGVDDVLSEVAVTAKKKTVPAFNEMAVIMEEQIKALDGAFRSMWQTFLDEGKISMDGIKDLFKNLMAELLHRAVTQPIVLKLQSAMSGAFGGSGGGLLGSGTGSLMGTIGSALLGAGIGGGIGGDAGAIGGAIGGMLNGAILGSGAMASIGSAVVGLMGNVGLTALNFIAPVIGPIIGALLGKALGNLLKRDPEVTFRGSNLAAIEEMSALGGFNVTARGGTGPQEDPESWAGQASAAIREFDDAIASFLSESQIEKIVAAMASWNVHLKNSAVDIENVLQSRFGVVLSTFSQAAQQYVRSFDGLEEQTQALARWVTAWNSMSDVIHKFVSSTVGEIATSATSGMSSTGALTFYGAALSELLSTFDETPEMMNEISAAIDMRYRAEMEYIKGIDNLVSQIGQSIDNQRMKLQGLIAADEQDPYRLVAKASAAMRGIRRAESPEDIARLVAQAQQFIQMAADAFPEDGITRMISNGRKGGMTEMFTSREDFIGGLLRMLDTIEGSATVRANTLRENALAESIALREETRMFAEQQGIDLDAIETAANGTTQAVQDQTVIIQDGNAQIIGAVNELGSLIAKQGFNDSGFRAQ
jgi:hypothetical protein